MRKRSKILVVFLILSAFVYFNNAAWITSSNTGSPFLLAHRGVHQTYDKTRIDRYTCTAQRITAPTHNFIENTLPSMHAAFNAGADMVEIDIHTTTDGHLAVFHDSALECRTNGTGHPWEHDLAYLQALDIGYGYTADSGKTFPLRGKGVGLMPSLKVVLNTFPNGSFLINFKGPNPRYAGLLAALLKQRTIKQNSKLMVYGGGGPPTERLKQLMPEIRSFSREHLKSCLIQYETYGWTGIVPKVCYNTGLIIPINIAPYICGWPNRFMARMKSVNITVFLVAAIKWGEKYTNGIDDLLVLDQVPRHYSGGIWTNKIEVVSPAIKQRFN